MRTGVPSSASSSPTPRCPGAIVAALCPSVAQPCPRIVSEACGVLQRSASRNPNRSRSARRHDVGRRLLRRGADDHAGRAAASDEVAQQLGELASASCGPRRRGRTPARRTPPGAAAARPRARPCAGRGRAARGSAPPSPRAARAAARSPRRRPGRRAAARTAPTPTARPACRRAATAARAGSSAAVATSTDSAALLPAPGSPPISTLRSGSAHGHRRAELVDADRDRLPQRQRRPRRGAATAPTPGPRADRAAPASPSRSPRCRGRGRRGPRAPAGTPPAPPRAARRAPATTRATPAPAPARPPGSRVTRPARTRGSSQSVHARHHARRTRAARSARSSQTRAAGHREHDRDQRADQQRRGHDVADQAGSSTCCTHDERADQAELEPAAATARPTSADDERDQLLVAPSIPTRRARDSSPVITPPPSPAGPRARRADRRRPERHARAAVHLPRLRGHPLDAHHLALLDARIARHRRRG